MADSVLYVNVNYEIPDLHVAFFSLVGGGQAGMRRPGRDTVTAVTDDLASRCALLSDSWQWWATTLEAMDAGDWMRPTRLEGWDVNALVAHHGMFVTALSYLATQPVDEAPGTTSARDMLRRFNEPGGVATTSAQPVAEVARQQAATMSRDDFIARFLVDAPAALARAREAGPIVIDYFGNGTFPFSEAVAIGVMESVVHGLDLADAVDARRGDMPPGPVQFTTDLLASLADPVDFIEAATGRRSPTVLPVLR
jgi:uncharacterized protein (TIGR03083 family)